MPIPGREHYRTKKAHFFRLPSFGRGVPYICRHKTWNELEMKKQLQQKIQKQTLKDEKLHQMEVSGAEAVIQMLTEEGFRVQGEFLENRVALEFTLSTGKTITLQVDYTSLTTGCDNIKKLITQLDR